MVKRALTVSIMCFLVSSASQPSLHVSTLWQNWGKSAVRDNLWSNKQDWYDSNHGESVWKPWPMYLYFWKSSPMYKSVCLCHKCVEKNPISHLKLCHSDLWWKVCFVKIQLEISYMLVLLLSNDGLCYLKIRTHHGQ